MKKTYILDACSLIALLKDEEGCGCVKQILNDRVNEKATVIMHKINLFEVYYGFYREHGKEYADEIIKLVVKAVSVVSDVNDSLFTEAGRLKATYKISLADSIALAQTLVLNGELLTCDHHEFDVVEKNEKIKFKWIR